MIIMKCGFCNDKHYYGRLVEEKDKDTAKCPNCGHKLIVVVPGK